MDNSFDVVQRGRSVAHSVLVLRVTSSSRKRSKRYCKYEAGRPMVHCTRITAIFLRYCINRSLELRCGQKGVQHVEIIQIMLDQWNDSTSLGKGIGRVCRHFLNGGR